MAGSLFQADIFSRIVHATSSFSSEDVRESVRTHLENLLNALQGRDDLPKFFRETSHSLAVYGLHGYNSANLESHAERYKLLQSIKLAITMFEPRLERVEIEDQGILHPFILVFNIRGVLRFEKYVDHVAFGTTIHKYGNTIVKN